MPRPVDDDGPADLDPEELRPSRTALRRERKFGEAALASLARDLVAASARTLGKLGLDEAVLDPIREVQAIRSATARNRALRSLRQQLREQDSDALRLRLDRVASPSGGLGQAARQPTPAEQWATRLISEGDAALDLLVSEAPHADRKALRVLVRNAVKASEKQRKRTVDALVVALRPLVRGRPAAQT